MWNSDSEDWYSIIFVMVLKNQGEMILLVEFKMSKKDLGARLFLGGIFVHILIDLLIFISKT